VAAAKTKTKKKKKKTRKKRTTATTTKKLASAEEFFSSIQPTPEYVKHLIECRCSLPQFRSWDDPPSHKFVVFSVLNEQAEVMPSYAKCNNCGIIHRVKEVGVSITIKKEEMRSLTTIEDLETQVPKWLANILKSHDCDLHVWQEAKFIYDNELWGRFIVLSKDHEDEVVIGKLCQILGKTLHKIEVFDRDDAAV